MPSGKFCVFEKMSEEMVQDVLNPKPNGNS